jgi:hypothetical protein
MKLYFTEEEASNWSHLQFCQRSWASRTLFEGTSWRGYIHAIFFVVLSCVDRSLAKGRSLTRFILLSVERIQYYKIDSESKQTWGINLWQPKKRADRYLWSPESIKLFASVPKGLYQYYAGYCSRLIQTFLGFSIIPSAGDWSIINKFVLRYLIFFLFYY